MTKKTKLILLIPVGAVILNGLGYIVALNLKSTNKTDGTASAAAEPAPSPEHVDRVPERSREDRIKEEKAMARRAAGMAGDRAYVSELLRVTEDLAHRPPSARRPVVVRSPPPPPPPRAPGRFRIVERSAPRESAPPSEAPPAPAQPPPTSGLLLVTTTPRGLLVQVDEVPVDLTPTRASLKVGSHHVALFDGNRKIYETNVDVKGGAPTTLLRDLSSEVQPSHSEAVASAPPPFAKQEGLHQAAATSSPAPHLAPAPARPSAPPPIPPSALADRPPSVAARTPPRRASSLQAMTGGLEVTSPGLYGEIWINGRPWGFPPVAARDLPPGPTRVTVRVNGVEERSAVVAVKPGLTTAVQLNRREGIP